MSAVLSPCRRYRYALERDLGTLTGTGTCLFVMLNPSTADEERDDPTITRCMNFARAWGYATLTVGNLFAYRTAHPELLREVADRVGPDNDQWLERLVRAADLIVAAWGACPIATERGPAFGRILAARHCKCLGRTRGGHPAHPLYLSSATRPVEFT